jgi:hypothetical protein
MEIAETRTEFTGETAWAVIGAFCCLPYGVYYYFNNKETVWVCPSCGGSVQVGASTCKHCGEDLSDYE